MQAWERADADLIELVREQTNRCLAVYEEDPSRVEQDANNELRISEGGYNDRQIYELIQNGVDAARAGGGRVDVLLTDRALYVANDGEPFTTTGVQAIMASDLSRKEDDRIGRFGIGFKSVLAVSDSPRVYSKSVSFGFDAEWAAKTILEAGFESPRYPVMRLARLLNAVDDASADSELEGLMSWASTVILLPLSIPPEVLSARLAEFPREFLLFSSHMREARLRDETHRHQRELPIEEIVRQEASDSHTLLEVGGAKSSWTVVHALHRPSGMALEDAGRIAGRGEIDVQYAVPNPPGAATGRFWAYFPTASETTLAGYVNAPWRLSDDRTQLLEGRFNFEILVDVVPRLVGTALPLIHNDANPMAALDALPARGREARNWADGVVNVPIFDYMKTIRSVPNCNGGLTRPSLLNWVDDVELDWLKSWTEAPSAPLDRWVHPEAYRNNERLWKVRRLVGEPVQISEWLEALVRDGSAESSAAAIRLAAHIARDSERFDRDRKLRIQNAISRSRFIRLEDGSFRRPEKGGVFVRVAAEDSGHDFVDPALADLPGVRIDLRALGVVVLDRTGELHSHLRAAKLLQSSADQQRVRDVWTSVWSTARELPLAVAQAVIREDLGGIAELMCRVRTADSGWRPIGEAYLAGAIVPADGSRDKDRLIDPHFHRSDVDLLRSLGAVEAPVWRHDPPRERWRDRYEQHVKDQFIRNQTGSRPDESRLILDGAAPPWPLAPLETMSDGARVEATKLILARGMPDEWTVRHTTNASYGIGRARAPEIWFLRKHGLVETSFGPLRPGRAVVAQDGIDHRILPSVELSDEIAIALGVRTSIEDFDKSDWGVLKAIADTWPEDDRRAEFYSWLPGNIDTPSVLVVRVGARRQAVAPVNIGVTTDPSVYSSMIEAQVPAIWVKLEEDAERFIDLWDMKRGKDLLQEEIVPQMLGEAVFLLEEFPPLKLYLEPEDHEIRLQRCARIVKMTATPQGQRAFPLDCLRDGSTIFVTASDPIPTLMQVARALPLSEFWAPDAHRVLDRIAETAKNQLRQRVRMAEDDDRRLLEAVGVDALRRSIPAQALEVLEGMHGNLDPKAIAALARSVHGVNILKQLSGVLAENGLEPPKEWTGRSVARQFCADLRFPVEWAGFPGAARPALEVVDGPVELERLHEYQVFVTERIQSLLVGVGPDRGVVSLPTGAGKTRVTVEALINAVRNFQLPLRRPVVWIAQSDELCEQAAETWTYVWRAVGLSEPMMLSRLWSNNEVVEEPSGFQLVVATIQKLEAIVQNRRGAYEWLKDPSVIVVDEAHASISPSYTRVLEWMGRTARGRHERRPLIGLTATPFRGTSDEETSRLVNRYDGNRLDRGAFQSEDPYVELQEMGVLARVHQKLLDGVDVELDKSDRDEIERLRRLPAAVSERLGADIERSLRIVESISQLPEEWTTLLFAPSVENARVLAALLSHRGVRSVSISNETEMSARRHYIEEFKAKRIRVLTNYNVLTQGFDAPKVQAVYVTRPTFSPNVYQQMIGRGLRGPKNGGSGEVLIVNVRDNLAQYGHMLAFNQFEYLWRRR